MGNDFEKEDARFSHTLTDLLHLWQQGDEAAGEAVAARVYKELKIIAHSHLEREKPEHRLQTTALVNELFLRLSVQKERLPLESRRHFYGCAARQVRQILCEYARARTAKKRGGEFLDLALDDPDGLIQQTPEILLKLDEALNEFERIDPEKYVLIELRFFVGLSIEDAAKVLNTSTASLNRSWRLAKAWLYDYLRSGK